MTLYQFIALDEMEQQEAIWEAGTHIAECQEGEHLILLYQINSFYVEVFYHMEYNVIRRYRPFSSIDQLQPYLNQISIENLKNKK